jgi:photosystem II stability/assembly factor-like uncharacterized protein
MKILAAKKTQSSLRSRILQPGEGSGAWHVRGRQIVALLFVLCAVAMAQQYVVQQSNTQESLRGISVVSSQIAWASGTHGTYLRTTNGGATWSPAQVPGAADLDFRDVEAFSADEAYLLAAGPGEQSRIYKTPDGGKTWALQFTNHDPKGFLDCMAFWDANHGIAVGDPLATRSGELKFELIATNDGGLHWDALPQAGLPPAIPAEGAFAASGTCIATQGKKNVWLVTGGKAARVFRSTDRGLHWQVADTPIVHGASESAGVFSVVFRDRKHGVIVGGDYKLPTQGGANIAFTSDGGLTWRLGGPTPQYYFSGVAFLGRSKSLLIVGTSHDALYDQSATSWRRVFDFNLNAVASDGQGSAFGVGPKGVVVRFSPAK